jgi:drug/metabolite transporter (DMT)-like permease
MMMVTTQRQPWAGVLLCVIGATGFAVKGIFAKLLYAQGWNFESVLCIRAFTALPLVALWTLHIIGRPAMGRITRADVLGFMFAGWFCYYLGAFLDFKALEWIAASIERVLLFAYPSIIVIMHALLSKQRPSSRVIMALTVTYAGIFLVVTGLNVNILQANGIGASLVLGCAITSATYYVIGERVALRIGSTLYTLGALTTATVALGVHYALSAAAKVHPLTLTSGTWLICIVLFSTVIPMLAMAEGVKQLGAPRASIISTIGPPATIVVGNLTLGESLGWAQWLGVICIVGGIMILELRKFGQSATTPTA